MIYAEPDGGVDHPRSRGVYGPYSDDSASNRGSSPLARGLRTPAASRASCMRIIPARAGFTRRDDGGRRLARDHPRSRGVYGIVVSAFIMILGSSPLARGLLPEPEEDVILIGIIPARAGFTTLGAPSTI